MVEQMREEKERAIQLVSLAMWGAVMLFAVLVVLFYLNIFESEQGKLVGFGLGLLAVMDVFLVRRLIGTMRASLGNI